MVGNSHISRFSYRFASFQGWRLLVSRRFQRFIHYFPDKKYGGEAPALAAAEATRDRLLALLKQFGNDPTAAFNACRAELVPDSYPQGLRPLKTKSALVRSQRRTPRSA